MTQMGTEIWAGKALGRDTRASRPNRAPNTKGEEMAKEDRVEESKKEKNVCYDG